MAELERSYIIPLRKQWLRTPRYKRAKKAATATRQFLERHMKSETVKLGASINELLWSRGITNPPGKIEVIATKDKEGVVRAELKTTTRERLTASSKKPNNAQKKTASKKLVTKPSSAVPVKTVKDAEVVSSVKTPAPVASPVNK